MLFGAIFTNSCVMLDSPSIVAGVLDHHVHRLRVHHDIHMRSVLSNANTGVRHWKTTRVRLLTMFMQCISGLSRGRRVCSAECDRVLAVDSSVERVVSESGAKVRGGEKRHRSRRVYWSELLHLRVVGLSHGVRALSRL